MTDLEIIQEFSAAGRHQECLQTCQNYLQANQEEAYAYKYAGKSLLALGQLEKAQQCLVKAHQLDGSDPEIAKDIGNIFLNHGNTGTALGWYETALEIKIDYAPAISNIANLKRLSGKTQEAIDLFKRAIQADPKLIQAYIGAATSFLALADLDQAKSFAKKALEINSNTPGVNETLGIIYQNERNPSQAIEYYKKEVEINPKAYISLLNSGLLLLQNGQAEAALELLVKASALAPSEQCSLLLAQVYQNLGQFKEAINEYQKLDISQSKDKSIPFNLGLCLLNTGHNNAAIEKFKIAIQLDETYIPALGNIGTAFKREGRNLEAIQATQKVLDLDPDNTDAHINLGAIYQDIGQLNDALAYTLKSIQLNTDNPTAHMNLGGIYKDLGQLDHALASTLKALELKPDNPIAHMNLGGIYQDLGQLDNALVSTLKSLELEPENPGALNNLNVLITKFTLSEANTQSLTKAYEHLINLYNISHSKLSKIFTQAFLPLIQEAAKSDPIVSVDNNALVNLANDWRLRKSLTLLIPPHQAIEQFLTRLRKELLELAANQQKIPEKLKGLTEALATQCFLNEYVYEQSPEEESLVNQLIYDTRHNQELLTQYLAIIACYTPIHKLNVNQEWLKDYPTAREEGRALIQTQLEEPKEEERIKDSIQSDCEVNDAVSAKVQDMYEENPYPRYRYADFTDKSVAQNISKAIRIESTKKNLQFAEELTSNSSRPRILIAGCGTGNQVINASRYKNAQITAIDLSSSSLAYAIRKANEYGMNNVDFRKMDLLDVGALDETFDTIECGGVLHHMEAPAKGLSALTQRLKPGGYIKIGLYSDIARQVIVEARNQIKALCLKSTPDGIRTFRTKVLSGEFKELSDLPQCGNDFYVLSACRDLCFHVQEHRFTTDLLQNLLDTNGLIFCGFIVPEAIRKNYRTQFPSDTDITSLKNWGNFEKQHPSTFAGMYQFWAYKPS